MPHCIFQPHTTPTTGQILTVSGPEAHHAIRVKRLEINDPLDLLTGQGHRAHCIIQDTRKSRGEWELVLRVLDSAIEPPTSPSIHVRSAVPKGDALEQMIDGLSQVGVATWSPLLCTRSIVDPRETKLSRLHRICEESLKQSARPWLMQIADAAPFATALNETSTTLIIADASGQPYTPTPHTNITLLIGPEGGFTPAELAAAQTSNARICSFGRHIMRIEVAAVVAAAHILATRA
jgi:16S rRNA (uracil1498-N3)-methyltransferase